MIKKNFKSIAGLTLIEILIGIVITTIMMGAMYTSYAVVNQSYSQVSAKAKISKGSRDLITMLMRDVRMAGFKYYAGTHEIEKYRQDTAVGACNPEGVTLPKLTTLIFENGYDDPSLSHNPLVIRNPLKVLILSDLLLSVKMKYVVTQFKLFMRISIRIIYYSLIEN